MRARASRRRARARVKCRCAQFIRFPVVGVCGILLAARAHAAPEAVVNDRTETRVTSSKIGESTLTSYELENSLVGALAFRGPVSHLRLSYEPRFAFRSLLGSSRVELLHSERVEYGWNSHDSTFTLGEQASYGEINLLSLAYPQASTAGGTTAAAASAPPAAAPGSTGATQAVLGDASTLRYASTSLDVSETTRWTRIWSLRLHGSYSASGGLDAPSRLALPFFQTILGDVDLVENVSPLDTCFSSLAVAQSSFKRRLGTTDLGQAQALIVTLSEGWRRRWSRHTNTTASTGFALVRVDTEPNRVRPYPFLDLSADVSSGRPSSLVQWMIHGHLAPEANRLTAVVDTRGEIDLGVGAVFDKARVDGRVSALSSLPPVQDYAFSQFLGSASITYRIADALAVESGVRAAWQRIRPGPDLLGSSVVSQVAFLAVTLTTPVERF